MTYLHVHIKVDTGCSSQASHSLMALESKGEYKQDWILAHVWIMFVFLPD